MEDKCGKMAQAILDYLYEEGEGKISVAEAIGILELVKLDIIEEARN